MHIHFEDELVSMDVPRLDINSWSYSETLLEQILVSHGEGDAREGDRFLVGRLRTQYTLIGHLYPDIILYDYILTCSASGWERHLAVYITNTPYNYDFDVFAMRPIEELRSVT